MTNTALPRRSAYNLPLSINEARIVASYHQTSRYHHLPLVQMQAAETLLAANGKREELGRELLDWAVADLEIYWQKSYNAKSGKFLGLMTDGTPLRWQEAKTDYYTPSSFAPKSPDACIFWAAAMANRMTGDDTYWQMARELGEQLGLGHLPPRDDAQGVARDSELALCRDGAGLGRRRHSRADTRAVARGAG